MPADKKITLPQATNAMPQPPMITLPLYNAKNTLPHDGTQVLAWATAMNPGDELFGCELNEWTIVYYRNGFYINTEDGERSVDVTHWLPLPDPMR